MPPKTGKGVPFQLSAEQLALQAARRELKEKKASQVASDAVQASQVQQGKILRREWLESGTAVTEGDDHLSIMTWNMLAQSLVRRDLFPNSDALKFSERAPMLSSEILAYDADILCLQEVDKLDTLLPAIEARYSHIYTSGRKKEHGCMVLFKKELFELHSQQTVYYDEEEIRHGSLEGGEGEQSSTRRRGASRATKNIGLIVAFRRKGSNEKGFVVATTHLFWHPAFVYERTKQVGLLLRSVSTFRRQNSLEHWPCFIAGDFNLTPDDIAYSLMVGETITASQQHALEVSRVVHISIDPMTAKNYEPKPISEEEAEAQDDQAEEKDPDKVIMNSRPCVPSDGLLDLEELKLLFQDSRITPLRSLYDEFLATLLDKSVRTIKTHTPQLEGRKGGNEPVFTSYTHFWKNTLDYIFLSPPEGYRADVRAVLRPHTSENLGTGLPRKDVCGSDHVSLAVKMVFRAGEQTILVPSSCDANRQFRGYT